MATAALSHRRNGRSTKIADLPLVLTVHEVALELGCSDDSVYYMIAEGVLKSITVGKTAKRISRKAFARLVDEDDPS